jgi:hypothetical protein
MPNGHILVVNHTGLPGRIRSPIGPTPHVRRVSVSRRTPMLDIAFLVVGALFLGACALYALACDKL